MRISLKQAVSFHGHLGPYLVLGLKAGELALKKLKAKKYFSLSVSVWGAALKPKSCIIDGLQLSTGATYGKGNIKKLNGRKIKILFFAKESGKKVCLGLKSSLSERLNKLTGHADAHCLARELYRRNAGILFDLIKI